MRSSTPNSPSAKALALVAALALCVAAGAVWAAQSRAVKTPKPDWVGATAPPFGDMSYGDPKAPVTVVEYTSVLCPYCGAFRKAGWPGLKRDLVDSGQVRWVVRELVIGNTDFVGFVMARCAGPDKALGIVEEMFSRQRELGATNSSPEAFVAFASTLGFDRKALLECVGRKSLTDGVNEIGKVAREKFGATGTPTFIVDGRVLPGADATSLRTAVEEAVRANLKPSR